MKICNTEFVVFDVETTGLSALDGDRIIEIAALKFKDGKIINQFHSLINPKRPMPPEATAINQITQEMLSAAPYAQDVLPGMIDFIAGACLVGHNVRFDLGFLCYELSLMGRRLNDGTPVVDTLKMAKELIPYLSSYRLSYLANSLGISVGQTHRAMADVELTANVMKRLFEMAHDRKIHDIAAFLGQFGVEKPSFKINQLAQSSLF